MSGSLVSIITPAYKAEAFIARAVSSVQAQMHTDWEMIIISDDGQDYHAILASHNIADPRLRFASTGQVGSGPSRGRNIGLDMAKGDFITTLDADDEYHPAYLSILQKAAEKYGIAMVFLAYKLKADGKKLPLLENEEVSLNAECVLWNIDDFIKCNGRNVNMFARKLLKHRYAEHIKYGEDFFFDVQFFHSVEQVPVFHEKYYIYHHNPESLTSGTKSDLLFIENYKEIVRTIEAIDTFPQYVQYDLLATYHHRLFQNYLYLSAKTKGECTDFYDFMAKFPQHFT